MPNLYAAPSPVSQIVLLGASNLTVSLALVIETAQRLCGRPSQFLIAAGHGRSYGIYSRVLFRGLPGIIQCGLWDALAKRPRLPTFALLTDLGNDIGYEQPPERLIGWVEWCIERLTESNVRIVVTALPVHSLERLSPWQYRFFRSLLFPSRRLTWEQAIERAQTVNRLLRDLCAERGIALIEQQREWYGVDPIHIQRHRRASAYHEILKHWLGPGCDVPPVARIGFRDGWRLQFLLPQCQSLFGLELHRKQPCGWLPGGSSVSLY